VEDPETGWHHGDYYRWTNFHLALEVNMREWSMGLPTWFRLAMIDLLDQHDEGAGNPTADELLRSAA